jgi:branched-chain amino acid transport system ATP-binding protein
VRENLVVGGYGRPRTRTPENVDRVLSLFPRLADRLHTRAGVLSGGEQQMVAIGRALMARPRLLLLDEPSLGLAPALVDHMFEIIDRIHVEGVSVLLVEQNVARALELADRAYVLEEGRIVASGRPEQLLGETRIQEAYLGLPGGD